MKDVLFEQKIKSLTNDALIVLLKKTANANTKIFDIAVKEANRRNLQFAIVPVTEEEAKPSLNEDLLKLKVWNWAAFLLMPIWVVANRLDRWIVLYLIPIVNIGAMIYLGYHGNRLAYKKSSIRSVDDFLIIQKQWSSWALRFLFFSMSLAIVVYILETLVTNLSQ